MGWAALAVLAGLVLAALSRRHRERSAEDGGGMALAPDFGGAGGGDADASCGDGNADGSGGGDGCGGDGGE